MYLAMLTLPLLGSIFSGFFGRKVGVSGAQFTTFTFCLQSLLNRVYSSLEWFLNSPPKPHAFVSLPLQSSIWSSILCTIFKLIADKKINVLLSISGAILLTIPFRQLMILLKIGHFYPIIAGVYSCILISVMCSLKNKNIPKVWVLTSMFVFSVFFSYLLLRLEVNTYFGDLAILTVTLDFTIGNMYMISHTNSSSPLYMNNPDTSNNNPAGVSHNGGSSTNNVTDPSGSINESLENYNRLNKDTEKNKTRLRHRIDRFNALIGELNNTSSRKNKEEDMKRILASLSIVRKDLLDKCEELKLLSDVRDSTLEQLKIQHRHYNTNLSDFRFKNHKHESAKFVINEARTLANRSL